MPILFFAAMLAIVGCGRNETRVRTEPQSPPPAGTHADDPVAERSEPAGEPAAAEPYRAMLADGPDGIGFSFVPFRQRIGRPKPWLSPEKAVSIYCDYQREAGFWDRRDPPDRGRVVFLDVDFDGVLELLWNVVEGRMNCNTTELYAIDRATLKVCKVKYDESVGNGDLFSHNWLPDSTRLVVNRKTSERGYAAEGIVCAGGDCAFVSYGASLFTWRKGVFKAESVACVHGCQEPGSKESDPYDWTFFLRGRKLDYISYCKAVKSYSKGFYDLGVRLGELDGAARVPITSLRREMLKAYNSFAYGVW